jgi:hypothetical protein
VRREACERTLQLAGAFLLDLGASPPRHVAVSRRLHPTREAGDLRADEGARDRQVDTAPHERLLDDLPEIIERVDPRPGHSGDGGIDVAGHREVDQQRWRRVGWPAARDRPLDLIPVHHRTRRADRADHPRRDRAKASPSPRPCVRSGPNLCQLGTKHLTLWDQYTEFLTERTFTRDVGFLGGIDGTEAPQAADVGTFRQCCCAAAAEPCEF